MTKNIEISNKLALNIEKLLQEIDLEQNKSKKLKKHIELSEVALVTDKKIWQKNKIFFEQSAVKKFGKIILLDKPKCDEKNSEKVTNSVKNFRLILAFGSGTINDLCKISAVKNEIPYALMASAASMNGFVSKNASILINGHKKTIPATQPIALFCDLDIIKKSPTRLTRAGIGDSLCYFGCWLDWYLSHKILQTNFDQKPFDLLEKKIQYFVKNFRSFSLTDEKFLKLLLEILIISGEGMNIAKGSYPASQSEHLISHCLEMKFPKIMTKKLHGEVIAVTSYSAAMFFDELLTSEENFVNRMRDKFVQNNQQNLAELRQNLTEFFDEKVAEECLEEYSQKLNLMKKSEKNISSESLTELYSELKNKYFFYKKLRKIFRKFRIGYLPKDLGLKKPQYDECVDNAKFIRNRFTILDLL